MLTQAEPSASGIADLSGVRGGAALIVLFAHVIQVFWLRFSGLDTFLHLSSSAAGHYAVVTFFVLSGFLITHSIELNARRYGRLRLDVFFAARIARLYPPLLVAIALSVAIYLLLGYFDLPGRAGQMKLVNDLYSAREIIHVTPREWLSALLMSHGMLEINGPLWSLYMEAKLYVVFACLYGIAAGHRTPLVLAGLILATYSGLHFNPEFSRYATIWLTGCCAYYAFQGADSRRKIRFALCAGLIVFIVLAELAFWFLNHPLEDVPRTWQDILIALVIAFVLFRRSIEWPGSRQIADCSYSLYATHFPILLVFQSLLIWNGGQSFWLVFFMSLSAVAVALTVAWLGGRVEAQKQSIQEYLLALYAIVGSKMRHLT